MQSIQSISFTGSTGSTALASFLWCWSSLFSVGSSDHDLRIQTFASTTQFSASGIRRDVSKMVAWQSKARKWVQYILLALILLICSTKHLALAKKKKRGCGLESASCEEHEDCCYPMMCVSPGQTEDGKELPTCKHCLVCHFGTFLIIALSRAFSSHCYVLFAFRCPF